MNILSVEKIAEVTDFISSVFPCAVIQRSTSSNLCIKLSNSYQLILVDSDEPFHINNNTALIEVSQLDEIMLKCNNYRYMGEAIHTEVVYQSLEYGRVVKAIGPCRIVLILLEAANKGDHKINDLLAEWQFKTNSLPIADASSNSSMTDFTLNGYNQIIKQDPINNETWDFSRAHVNNFIRTRLLHEKVFRTIPANTPMPITFCNGIFEGRMLFLLNTKSDPDSCYSARFNGMKYTFELQIQGKFVELPKGTVFVGGEITKKMELGLLTKGICSTLLQLIRKVIPLFHHSFGDRSNFEYPHISAPLWSSVDKLIVTPKDGSIPTLGSSLGEDAVSREQRRKGSAAANFEVDLDSTYTFSLKTSNIDLEQWSMVNVPLVGSSSLHTFWADANMRIVIYCVPVDPVNTELNSTGLPKFHPQNQNQYLFALEVQHCSNASKEDWNRCINEDRTYYQSHRSSSKKPVKKLSIHGKYQHDDSEEDDFFDAIDPVHLPNNPFASGNIPIDDHIPVFDSTKRSYSIKIPTDGDSETEKSPLKDELISNGHRKDVHTMNNVHNTKDLFSTEYWKESALYYPRLFFGYEDNMSGEVSSDGMSSEDDGEVDDLSPSGRSNGLLTVKNDPSDPMLVNKATASDSQSVLENKDLDRIDRIQRLDELLTDVGDRSSFSLRTTLITNKEDDTKKRPDEELKDGTLYNRFGLAPIQQPPLNLSSSMGLPAVSTTLADAGFDYVNAIFDIDEHRMTRQNTRRTLYVFIRHSKTEEPSFTLSKTLPSIDPVHPSVLYSCTMRSYKEWTTFGLPLQKVPKKPLNYYRLNDTEHRRRDLAFSYEQLVRTMPMESSGTGSRKSQRGSNQTESNSLLQKLDQFLQSSPHYDTLLTKPMHGGVGAKRNRIFLPTLDEEALVCVKLGNFFWSEECLGITREELIFLKPVKNMKSNRLRIPLSQVIHVYPLDGRECPLPLPNMACFSISTFSRQFVIMIRGVEQRNRWLHLLTTYCQSNNPLAMLSLPNSLPTMETFSSNSEGLGDHSNLDNVDVDILLEKLSKGSMDKVHNEGGSSANYIRTMKSKELESEEEVGKNRRGSSRFSKKILFAPYNAMMDHSKGTTASHPPNTSSSGGNGNNYYNDYTGQHLDLLVKPKGWKHGDRLILNARNFPRTGMGLSGVFSRPSSRDILKKFNSSTPCEYVQFLLDLAFRLCDLVNRDETHQKTTASTNLTALHSAVLDSQSPQLTSDSMDNNMILNADLMENYPLISHPEDRERIQSSDPLTPQPDRSRSNSSNDNPTFMTPSYRSGRFNSSSKDLAVHQIASEVALQRLWLDFMDAVSLLQCINLQRHNLFIMTSKGERQSSPEAVCLFLNLYHCILLHAFLVVGVPTTIFKWQSFFRNNAYEAFGDIFSLAELEHCIIRHAMTRPSINVVAQSFIPNENFEFALLFKDYRLLWAINCGSTANILYVPVYNPEKLDFQLEFVIRSSLDIQIQISKHFVITLPQICQWYFKDFELSNHQPNNNSSNKFDSEGTSPMASVWSIRDVLFILSNHLSGEVAMKLLEILQNKKNYIAVRYSSMEFTCRYLKKLDDAMLSE